MRFYMVDRIEEIKYGEHIIGVKCISMSDDVFNEHFPGYPIFPGSLLMEGMAQLAGSLFELTMMHRNEKVLRCVLSMVNRMKFRSLVVPGDKVILKAMAASVHSDCALVKVRATVDDRVCAEGELTFTFHDVENPLVEAERENLYRSYMRHAKVVE